MDEAERLRKLAEDLLYFADRMSSPEEATRLRTRSAELQAKAEALEAGEKKTQR